MDTCLLCGASPVAQLLDFGPQPICNRFLASPTAVEATFPLRIGQCSACGLVQTVAPLPAAELRPRCDWITYNEPEGHLDRLAEVIVSLPGLTRDCVVCGISFKDDSLLRRLRDRGYARTWRIDLRRDLGIAEPGVGVETLQERLNCRASATIAQARGKASLVIARQIWEHAADPAAFVDALAELLAPHGYLMLEVPDCERSLATCNYTMVWEEHTLYFTPATFRHALVTAGLLPVHEECVPYPLENSLVAVARRGRPAARPSLAETALVAEKRRAECYARGFAGQGERIGIYLAQYRKQRGRIAVLGAGHLACTFINLLELKDHLDCLVDDNPYKRGLYMPGSRLPIYEPRALVERNIGLCLLSVNLEGEEPVLQRNQAFTQAGGTFHSIFPTSKYALPL